MFGLRRIARRVAGGCQRRPRAVEGETIETLFRVVEGGIDADELFFRHHIAGQPRLDLAKARVVGILEGLEGAGEILERAGHVVGRSIWFQQLGS